MLQKVTKRVSDCGALGPQFCPKCSAQLNHIAPDRLADWNTYSQVLSPGLQNAYTGVADGLIRVNRTCVEMLDDLVGKERRGFFAFKPGCVNGHENLRESRLSLVRAMSNQDR